MLTLGLENSGTTCSCAVVREESVLAETAVVHPEHSRVLPGLIDTVLNAALKKLQDIDLYAISIGPGSFTSLRVGLSTLKAIAQCMRKSLVGVSALDALAAEVYPAQSVCSVIDAKRGEVYYALYRFNGEKLQRYDGPHALPVRNLCERVDEATVFVGSGVPALMDVFEGSSRKGACVEVSSPKASTVCRLGRKKFELLGSDDIGSLEPAYILPSYAEVRLKLTTERMRMEHIDAVVQIENESFRDPWSRRAFLSEVNSETALPIVAIAENQVVGYLMIWLAYDEMHLGNIAVAKRWRRKGIGDRLMKWLVEEAKRREVARITLEVRTSNYLAMSLYRKFGFKEVALRKRYYPDREDACVMVLDLKSP